MTTNPHKYYLATRLRPGPGGWPTKSTLVCLSDADGRRLHTILVKDGGDADAVGVAWCEALDEGGSIV